MASVAANRSLMTMRDKEMPERRRSKSEGECSFGSPTSLQDHLVSPTVRIGGFQDAIAEFSSGNFIRVKEYH